MKQLPSDVSVVFRMPGCTGFEGLVNGPGTDVFRMHPFDRQSPSVCLRGTFTRMDHLQLKDTVQSWSLSPSGSDTPAHGRAHYTALVQDAVKRIEQGEMEKVVLAAVFRIAAVPDLFQMLIELERRHPDAFVYAINTDGIAMIGASPETLLSCQGQILRTEALGGTPANGQYGIKEIMEHQQICDYIASVLNAHDFAYSRGARTVKQAGTVEHLRTGFEIEARSREENQKLAEQLHPTPAVCGLPPETASAYIQAHEGFSRNYYAGYLGPERGSGEFSYFVNLRCAQVFAQEMILYAGAGINRLSDPGAEWDEVNRKKETIAGLLK